MNCKKCESSLNLIIFKQKFLLDVERAMRSVSGGELCMCACHTNHSVDCIKERIKLSVRKYDGICINLEMRQITVVCSAKHFMAY